MKNKIAIGVYLLITVGIPLTNLIIYLVGTDDYSNLSIILTGSAIGCFMSMLIMIPPLLMVTTLMGKKLDIDPTGKKIAEEFKDMSDEERDDVALSLFNQMQEHLPSFEHEDGSIRYMIRKGKDALRVKRTIEFMAQKIQPTDEGLIESMKGYAEYYQGQLNRMFVGARTIMFLMIAFASLLIFTQDQPVVAITLGIWCALYITFYFLSAKRPVYLLEIDNEKGKEFDSSLISQTIKSLWGPDKYKTQHYDVHVDSSGYASSNRNYGREMGDSLMGFVFKIIFTVIVSVIAVAFTPIYSIYYFCSNYWGNAINPLTNNDKWVKSQYSLVEISQETEESVAVGIPVENQA